MASGEERLDQIGGRALRDIARLVGSVFRYKFTVNIRLSFHKRCSAEPTVSSYAGFAVFVLGAFQYSALHAETPDLQFVEVAGGLNQPVDIQSPADGTNRLFIVERSGVIKILKGSLIFSIPFLDITDRVRDNFVEEGLLGLAFPADFASTGQFYVNYTFGATSSERETRISRFSVRELNSYEADPDSEEVLMSIDQPFSNHNGGQLQFGPDGYLYIGTGDGGSGGDPGNRAQDSSELPGKMLRIDVNGDDFPGDPGKNYAIPPGNPYIGNANVLDEIWALGLRNPWRFSFDRGTGELYIADVGQNYWEEVNRQPAESVGGENYGWRVYEGNNVFNDSLGLGPGALISPVTEYHHSSGNCSITGGYVYRGVRFPRMHGLYFYGDYCSGRIWSLDHDGEQWASEELLDTSFSISTFGEDEAENLYFADFNNGRIWLLVESEESLPELPQLQVTQLVSGLNSLTDIRHAGDCSGRLFITEQPGRIIIVRNGAALTTPFLEITNRVKHTQSDDGLASVAFPPGFAANGHFYVSYTREAVGNEWESVISRFQISADPDIADPNSEEVLLVVDQDTSIHNVWQIQFGPDGYLYFASGDGGPGDDSQNYGQNPLSFRGKILRIDTESAPPAGENYAIPAGNPFINDPGVLDEIWAFGLRSPWRIAFDPATGDLYVSDVGQRDWEELNFQDASSAGGENYGWRVFEGNHEFDDSLGLGSGTLVFPIVEYPHLAGNCSIIGGYVYRGKLYPRMYGKYIYGDYCSGRIWGTHRVNGEWISEELIGAAFNIRTFGEDEAGNLYVGGADGTVYYIGDNDENTVLSIAQVMRDESGDFQFTFDTIPGRTMQVRFTQELDAPWQDIGAPILGDGTPYTFTDTSIVLENENRRFFRAVVLD